MLETVGITAVPVLVNTSRSIADDVPAPTEFNHVVTAVPTGDDPSRWTWMDTTAEVAPLGMLSRPTRDRRVLVLGGSAFKHRVVTTPPDGPFPFEEVVEVNGRINPLGVLQATVRMTLRGDDELLMRTVARVTPREAAQEFGKEFVRRLGFKGEVSAFAMSDPLATRDPFEVSFVLRRAGYLDWAAATSRLDTHAGMIDLDALETMLEKDRLVGTPSTLRRRVSITVPDGYAVTAPSGIKADKDAFQYSSTYEVTGNRITLNRLLTGMPRTLLAAHAADYTRIARSVASDFAQSFTARRETGTIPAIPDDMSAEELYHAAFSAYTAKDYEAALAIWRRNTEVDPKMANAWNGVGLTLRDLGRHEEAVEAIEKQIALEPSSKRAYKDLASVLEAAGEGDRAAGAYAKHIELNPGDGEAYQSVGQIYAEQKRHADAAVAFEKAAALLKPDPWLYQRLGNAYLEQKKPDLAGKAFDQALAVSQTPQLLVAIAWSLAEHGVDGARTLDLSARAIASIAETMRDVRAAGMTKQHFELMDRLAWAWEARGMVSLRKGDAETALTYFKAAWQLAAQPGGAFHLGEAYEKTGKTADAASSYLTARALTKAPDPILQAKMKEFYPSGDMEAMLKAADEFAYRERTRQVPGKPVTPGRAEFNALLNTSGHVRDLAFLAGDKELVTLDGALRALQFDADIPDATPVRLAVRMRVSCDAKVCYVNLNVPRLVK
jgi:tetratricopeptide (TPR) repeat protein